ncbi:MAG: CBS domain-containing protein [Candidatus Altiarchaeota archaeon]|nr:CBS domain-containing protein [Candidatus Altiarchaeota archaeon]
MDESVYSKNLISIDKAANLHEALELMEKKHVSRLLVTDEGKIIGILTEEDIAESLATGRDRKLKAEHFHIKTAATTELKTIDSDAPLNEAARLMLEGGFSSLPVIEDGEVIGIVTKTDLLRTLQDSTKEIRDFYTKKPLTVNPGDSLVSARKLMLEKDVHRLLVTNGGLLRGILTERDLAKGLKTFRKAVDKYPQADIQRLKVEHVATSDPETIKPKDTVGTAAKKMLDRGISGLPVVAIEFGILTKTDLTRGIAEGTLP